MSNEEQKICKFFKPFVFTGSRWLPASESEILDPYKRLRSEHAASNIWVGYQPDVRWCRSGSSTNTNTLAQQSKHSSWLWCHRVSDNTRIQGVQCRKNTAPKLTGVCRVVLSAGDAVKRCLVSLRCRPQSVFLVSLSISFLKISPFPSDPSSVSRSSSSCHVFYFCVHAADFLLGFCPV